MKNKIKKVKDLLQRYLLFEKRFLPIENIEILMHNLLNEKGTDEEIKKKVTEFKEKASKDKMWDNRFLPIDELNILLAEIIN